MTKVLRRTSRLIRPGHLITLYFSIVDLNALRYKFANGCSEIASTADETDVSALCYVLEALLRWIKLKSGSWMLEGRLVWHTQPSATAYNIPFHHR